MNYEEENTENNQYISYTYKFGSMDLDSKSFNDHSLLGEDYIYFKPEKIIFFIGSLPSKDNYSQKVLAGMEIWYRNIIDSRQIKSIEYKGEKTEDFVEFIIKPTEYLINCRLWTGDEAINKIVLKTNKGNMFEVGDEEGEEMEIQGLDGKNIIMSFFGSYKNYLSSLGMHLLDKKKYMQLLFTGYFELKQKLTHKDYRNEIIEKIEKKEFNFEDLVLAKTCLLPSTIFYEVVRFCIV